MNVGVVVGVRVRVIRQGYGSGKGGGGLVGAALATPSQDPPGIGRHKHVQDKGSMREINPHMYGLTQAWMAPQAW